jgi:hypothetical protein
MTPANRAMFSATLATKIMAIATIWFLTVIGAEHFRTCSKGFTWPVLTGGRDAIYIPQKFNTSREHAKSGDCSVLPILSI